MKFLYKVTNSVPIIYGEGCLSPLDCKSHNLSPNLFMPVKSLKKSTTKKKISSLSFRKFIRYNNALVSVSAADGLNRSEDLTIYDIAISSYLSIFLIKKPSLQMGFLSAIPLCLLPINFRNIYF